MVLNKTRGAGPITVSRPDGNGRLVVVETLPAPCLENTRDPLRPAKRGPKPKAQTSYEKARAFAASANWY